MNFQETSDLIKALKLAGVTHFKSEDFEVTFGALRELPLQNVMEPHAPKETAEATEKLKNLINTIKMSPEELVNKMFPDGAE
jgi:hypothetical protein